MAALVVAAVVIFIHVSVLAGAAAAVAAASAAVATAEAAAVVTAAKQVARSGSRSLWESVIFWWKFRHLRSRSRGGEELKGGQA